MIFRNKNTKTWTVKFLGKEVVCADKAMAERVLARFQSEMKTTTKPAPQVYKSFEAAVEDHGEDEEDLVEED